MAERALRVLAFAVVDDDLLDGQVAGAVRDAGHGRALKAAGVQYILNPFDDAADHAAHSLAEKIQSKEGV